MKKKTLISVIIVALIITSCIFFFAGENILLILSGDQEIIYNCDGSGDPNLYVLWGCYESSINEYTFISGSALAKSIRGEIYSDSVFNIQFVDLYLLVGNNWNLEYTFSLVYTHYLTFDLDIVDKTIRGFRFVHMGAGFYGGTKYDIATNGKLIVEGENGAPDQCDLTVYVEEYSDGPPVPNQEVNVKSQPGAIDLTEYTNNDGFAFFTLDYGTYVITVGSQYKTVNLNIPSWYETFTLTEPSPPGTMDIWPYLLLLLILAILFFGSIYYFKSKKTKEKK